MVKFILNFFFIIMIIWTVTFLIWGVTFTLALLIGFTWIGVIFCYFKSYWRGFLIFILFLLLNNIFCSYLIFERIIDNYSEWLISNLIFSLENSLLPISQLTYMYIPVECSMIDFPSLENSNPINFLFKRDVILKSIVLPNYKMAFCSVMLKDTPVLDLLLLDNIPGVLIPFVKYNILNNCFCAQISLDLANVLELYK